MSRLRLLELAGVLVLLAVVGGAAFFLGDSRALSELSVLRASPGQAANAMQNDEFYSDYRESTLVVTGTIASEQTNSSGTLIQLTTSPPFRTYCQLSQSTSQLHDGETVTVITEGYNAVRLPSGVSLSDCTIVSESGADG
jgi:hypothetical protein